MIDLNKVGIGALAGLLSGFLILGVGARISMRAVALAGELSPEFTLLGSLAILVIGSVVGLILGPIYQAIRRWLPIGVLGSVVYGVVLGILVAIPFFAEPGGELALATPVVGALLFAPLPLFYSLGLAALIYWMERRAFSQVPRLVTTGWLGLFSAALLFAFVRMMSMTDGVRVPIVLTVLIEGTGVPFHGVRDVLGLMGLLFAIAYCALCSMIFWIGYNRRPAKIASISLLLFAGLAFNPNTVRSIVRLSPGTTIEWTMFSLIAIGLMVASIFTFVRAGRGHDTIKKRETRWLVLVAALAGGAFLVMWGTILLNARFQLPGLTGLQTALTVSAYLWPWLLLPLALVIVIWRAHVWQPDADLK